jgi:hypothetical protein
VVDHPENRKFKVLSENIVNLETMREAQGILLRCGAVSYCLDQIVQRHEVGKHFLAGLNLPSPQPINQLFDAVVAPIWKLLEIQA